MAASSGNLKVMTINMSDNKNSPAAFRRKNVQEMINRYQPDIVFGQEIGAPKKKNWLLRIEGEYNTRHTDKEAGIMEKVTANVEGVHLSDETDDEYEESSDTGIMYKLEILSDFDNAAKNKIVDEMRREKGKLVWKPEALDELAARTCIVPVRYGNKKIVCISWHGQYKVSDDIKIETVKALQRFALKITENTKSLKNATIIIGGDFNLRILQKYKEISHPDFIIRPDKPVINARRSEYNFIDFFMHTKDIRLTNVEVREVPADERGQVYLDHDPITADITFVSTRGEE